MAKLDSGDVQFFSIALFKIGSLILAVLLGLQLIRSQLPFSFDINFFFTPEQFLFIYAVMLIILLAFIEGRTLQVSGKERGL